MFGESLIVSGKKREATKSWLTLPVSIILHAVIIVTAIVVPMLSTGKAMPELSVINIFTGAPVPPPPPPPPPAKKKSTSSSATKTAEKKDEAKPVTAGRFVAPIEVPNEIKSEDISSFGIEGGIDGGVEGGVEGGVIGGVLGGVEGGALTEDVSGAIRIAVSKAKLIHRVDPSYPQVALAARIHGVVVVEAVTDIFGKVRDARVVSGHPLLNDSALNAVKQWIYEPYLVGGVPKPVRFTVTVHFTLQNT